MRNKLQKFTDFASTLLPHEVQYLLSVEQFQDDDRLLILRTIAQFVENDTVAFDVSIDKRKYSNLKTWIEERLRSIDVDVQFELMSRLEQAIMTDSITPTDEKWLLKKIKTHQEPIFYFAKFYELAQHYRHFLLIRMRYADHKLVDDFLKNFKSDYDKSKATNERMHEATLDIVGQYASNEQDSKKWQRWLTEVFYDETLDGLNRYLALVRLIFIAFNYRQFEPLREPFDYLDAQFLKGQYYSKRLLLNYYGNRLLLHAKFQELEKAVYYGYFSIRGKNNEYIHYINNLSAVLQRQKKYQEALKLMRSAFNEMKATQNYHDKIGFVAFYVKCLNKTEEYRAAENYCESFLRVYKDEIFNYRWHIFFSVYLESILHQKKYDKLVKVVQRYNLLEYDEAYKKRAVYLPTIAWYNRAAALHENPNDRKAFGVEIVAYTKTVETDSSRLIQLTELLKELEPHILEVLKPIQSRLFELGCRL